jgi:predicted regulator of Ras-like GTPase activity (Roadblock/LC7/MglB family)
MIRKIIEELRNHIAGIDNYVVFYNSGIVFRTDFSESVNVPQLGNTLAQIITDMIQLITTCAMNAGIYERLIFETGACKIFFFQLGEESHLALFTSDATLNLQISHLKHYLDQMKEIVDVSSKELAP